MSGFVLASAGLAILCLVLLLPGLIRPRRVVSVDMDRENVAIARERLAEVGTQDGSAREESPELEAALLADLSGPDYVLGENPARGRWSALAFLLLVPLAAGLIYSQVGDVRWLDPSQGLPSPAESPAEVDIPQLLARLEQELAENPGNADGWAIAGRTYMVMNQFGKAEAAYARVHDLVGDDPDILTAWADASLMHNGGQYTAVIAARIERALELDPVQVNALWIGVFGSKSRGDGDTALRYLEQLRPLLADNPEALAQLQAQLETASSGDSSVPSDGAASGTDPPARTEAPVAALIELQVSMVPELRAALDPATPVFVFARASTGPAMPLAAVRLTVGDLPQNVRLDDDSAMIEGRNLSGQERVTVTARVALSGTPTARSGDLTSASVETVTRGGAPIPLRVDRRVP